MSAQIPANAVYTMKVVSRHRIKTNARDKMAKLQATAPANVYYELITDPEHTGKMCHHLYCYTVIKQTAPTQTNPEIVPVSIAGAMFLICAEEDDHNGLATVIHDRRLVITNALVHSGHLSGNRIKGFAITDAGRAWHAAAMSAITANALSRVVKGTRSTMQRIADVRDGHRGSLYYALHTALTD